MKVHLLFRDRDFDPAREPDPRERALVDDLELEMVIAAMTGEDDSLAGVARTALLTGPADPAAIRYRQSVLRDCLENEPVVREMHGLAVEALTRERKDHYFGRKFFRHPDSVRHQSIAVLQMFVEKLRALRSIAVRHHAAFRSEGFRTLLETIERELDDDYLATVSRHLKQLTFPHGALVSARLGEGNSGTDYVLREENPPHGGWLTRLIEPKPPAYSFRLHPRDEAGTRALAEIRSRGLNSAAAALARSADHISSFFAALRAELSFYIGCLNLHARLAELGAPVCLPEVAASGERRYRAEGLYDVGLALHVGRTVVGNEVAADGRQAVVVTGANQGGKSTFLRSVGLAQLMMQSGMFVPATRLAASACTGLFTHFKREEDAELESGKLDEELARMSDIVDHLEPGGLVLFNESFASTNEREGSEIARQIVTALVESGIRVVFVTHQYELAQGIRNGSVSALALRAERAADGTRTFRITEGAPQRTSHGEDLYREVFRERAVATE